MTHLLDNDEQTSRINIPGRQLLNIAWKSGKKSLKSYLIFGD